VEVDAEIVEDLDIKADMAKWKNVACIL